MKTICSLIVILLTLPLIAQENKALRISPNQRYIINEDGNPFFWLGDTAWELFHRLSREEATQYLENRAEKGFTVIQAVVLAELDGLNTPNAEGHTPLINNDPARHNEDYFKFVDHVVETAEDLGLYIGMLPTWGDKFNKRWGVGPEVFTPENAFFYGRFLGQRYRDNAVIWILGGDRPPDNEEDYEIIRAMARGIREGDNGNHLMTYHPWGAHSSSQYFHNDEWLDLNIFQSGHGELNNPNYRMTMHDYNLKPVKPVIDSEPNYEDHPINWRPVNGWFDDFDSRRAGYWSMLSGACGHTYGNHNIWQMWQPGREPISSARTPWNISLNYPGAYQAGYMRRAFESRPWHLLEPAQELLVNGPNAGGREIRVASASDGSFLMAYAPYGSNFSLSLKGMAAETVKIWWYNPRNHTAILQGTTGKGTIDFDPPHDERRGNDWLLIVEDPERNFSRPAAQR